MSQTSADRQKAYRERQKAAAGEAELAEKQRHLDNLQKRLVVDRALTAAGGNIGDWAWGEDMFPREDGRSDREVGLPRSNYTEKLPIRAMSTADKGAILARINRVPHG